MGNININEAGTIDPKPYKITGVILLILGILGIIFPYFASAMVVFIIASLLLVGGVLFFIVGLKGGKGAWAGILLGVILVAVGILMFVYPSPTLAVMTLIMGIFFLIVGIASLFLAYGVHPLKGWWAPIVSGVLSLILGILVLIGWPSNSEWIIGLFVGIDLLFEGFALMTLGYYVE